MSNALNENGDAALFEKDCDFADNELDILSIFIHIYVSMKVSYVFQWFIF